MEWEGRHYVDSGEKRMRTLLPWVLRMEADDHYNPPHSSPQPTAKIPGISRMPAAGI